VLRTVAQGHRDVPPADFDSVNPFGRWSYLLHFVAFPGAVLCAQVYLPAGWVFGALIASVFPASAALMALTGRLESAFSPAAVAGCIRIIGRDYVWLLVVTLLALAVALLGGRALASMPAAFASVVLGIWGLLAVFALTGSAVHAHRLEFDIPGDRPDPVERAREERDREWQAILDQAYAALRGGRPDAGYRTLRQFLAAQGDSPDAYYWLVEHLLDWEDKAHALGVAARLIDAELALGRPANAFDLWRRCRRFGTGLVPAPPAAAALAAYARSIGQQGAASELDVLARPEDAPNDPGA
jgi:hypothetical protein